MSIIKKALLFVVVGIGFSQTAQAECSRDEEVPTVEFTIEGANILVPSDAAVGAPFYEKEYTVPASKGNSYKCSEITSVTFSGVLNTGLLGAELSNKVYQTNIPGVGMRLSRGSAAANFVFPGSYTASSIGFNLTNSKFKIELVKTADVVGSGYLTGGIYATYNGPTEGTPLLRARISGNSIAIVTPSCKLESEKVMNITLPESSIDSFIGKGSTEGKEDFAIKLICSTGVNVIGQADIKTSFFGNTPSGMDKSSGVLVNENDSSTAAKGIGFQITSNGKAIAFEEKYLVGTVKGNTQTHLSFPLTVSYYQYGSDVSAGKVNSHMTYTISYD